jgi:hypothetical protein
MNDISSVRARVCSGVCAWAALLALSGCADVSVQKVTNDNWRTVEGRRYSLPKPYIQILPQGDDTIAVSVLMLPDGDNTYAIAPSSTMSTYVFQITTNQNGTLAAVEFKQDTSGVGQQLAASAATAAAQAYNMQLAQQLAVQTAVNTAQGSVDTAQAAYDKATAQVQADTQNGVPATQLSTDKAAQAAALSALQDAKAVLVRVRGTNQLASATASAGTPATNTNPTATTGSSFGPQSWTNPIEYELPEGRGGVLYAVNDTRDADGKRNVELLPARIGNQTQGKFDTANLGPASAPTLMPSSQPISPTTTSASLIFSRPATSIDGWSILTAANGNVTGNAKVAFTDTGPNSDHKSVTLTLPTTPKLAPGTYNVRVAFSYQPSMTMTNVPTEKVVSITILP